MDWPATAGGALVWVAGIILATHTMVPAYTYRARHRWSPRPPHGWRYWSRPLRGGTRQG